MNKTLLALIAFAAIAFPAQAIDETNVNAWFMYFGDHPVSDHWGVHLEAQARRADAGLTWQQLLFRPGINYRLNQHVMFTAGYAYIRSSPYGDYPAKGVFPEHRFLEQALIRHKVGKVALQHRLRLEQRFVGIPGTDQFELRNRFRYMIRADIPLPITTSKGNPFGIALYEEPFIHFGANRGLRYLDQNRTYTALTYKVTRFNRVEAGYMFQYLPQRNGIVFEHNHTLQFSWYSTTPFRREK